MAGAPDTGSRPWLGYALLAFFVGLLAFGIWWLSMADASMTGCGGG